MPSRKIEDLHTQFQLMVQQLLLKGQQAIQSTGWSFFITDGFRSFAEQTELYAQGRTKPGNRVTNAMAGESPHNFGLAVDLAFQKDGKLSYAPELYARIYPIARSLGFELGADWMDFTDKPHFEHPRWELLAEKEQNNMSNIFKLPSGNTLDIGNVDVNKVTATTWDEVVHQKLYIKMSEHQSEVQRVKTEIESSKDREIQDLKNRLIDKDIQINKLVSESIDQLPKTYNGKKVTGIIIEP